MVEISGAKYGISLRGNGCTLARRTLSAGREIIDLLEKDAFGIKEAIPSPEEGEIYFAVDQREAIIKRIPIRRLANIDLDKMVIFEMMSCLPGSADDYYFENYPCEGRPMRLGVAYPRNIIDAKASLIKERFFRPRGYKLAGLALASAYAHFGRREGGELICLIDVDPYQAIYCFVNGDFPLWSGVIPLGSAPAEKDEMTNPSFLADLTATLKYQETLLFQAGYSAPLSLIILSGESADDELAAQMSKLARTKAALPSFKKELFSSDLADRAYLFMLNLGLTVDK
jgi:hypothetical protein